MEQMAKRVQQVLDGVLARDIGIDPEHLQRNQVERSLWIETALKSPAHPTDWNHIRRAIAEIEQSPLSNPA